MIKNAALAFALSASLVAAVRANAQTVDPSSGTDPMSWINHYPSDTVLGQQGFFNIPSINAKLEDMLSRSDFNTVTKVYTENVPIAEVEGYIVISSCMPHDCGSEGDTIIYYPSTGDVVVGLIDNDAGSTGQYMNERIYGSADYTKLPGDVFSLLFQTVPTGR